MSSFLEFKPERFKRQRKRTLSLRLLQNKRFTPNLSTTLNSIGSHDEQALTTQ